MTSNKLRSQEWFGITGKLGLLYRSWMRTQGIPDDHFQDKPVIGICNTWSELTPCNAHFRELADYVKRGVYEAGGLPLEFPVMSLGETLMRPTAMLFRNLASMDVEETIRANPLDGVVLLTGCDKTTPSTLMGAVSAGLPTIALPGGPMLNGKFQGGDLGSGTSLWEFSEALRCGEMSPEAFAEAEAGMSRSRGSCNTMGTASSMACMLESLGMTLPGAAAIPAVDSRRRLLAHLTGRRIVDMVKENLTPHKVLTRKALENAIMVNAALGGSTNFVIHLLAIAGRLQIPLSLEDFDSLGSNLPLLVNLMPSGQYLMEDFYYAGGLPAVIKELAEHLHTGAMTVNGKSIRENTKDAPCYNREVIAALSKPFKERSGIAVVHGNLCPNGAVIKPSAATPELMKHRARAVVFESIEDYHSRIDDPDLDVDPDCALILKGVGPRGYPGMPEVGNMGIPKKLLERGVRDMIRISDGRMSGTAFGTVFLHVSPESAVGGPLAFVQNGDMIQVDVANRTLNAEISDEEFARRKEMWKPPKAEYTRGYAHLYTSNVLQAHQGADFDFLVGYSGPDVRRHSH